MILRDRTERADFPRCPLHPPVISNGAGRPPHVAHATQPSSRTEQADFFLPHSLLRMRRPAQREISLLLHFAFEPYVSRCHNPPPWSAPSTSTSWPASPASSTSA